MYRAVLAIAVVVSLCTSCTRDKAVNPNCTNCPDTVSFSKNIIPIFAQNCNGPGCHNAADASGGLKLDSADAYAQATEPGTGYVIPGNPNESVLLIQLYPGSAPHMPTNAQLDDCTIQEIFCWIEQGAKNN